MARFMDRNVDGIDVPEEVIARMEDGASGIDIAKDFIGSGNFEKQGLYSEGGLWENSRGSQSARPIDLSAQGYIILGNTRP
ncbi:MAG: hypothetical protein R6T90_07645 [Dissulfuribacterales bacterium]